MKNKGNKAIRNILIIRFRRIGDAVLSTVLCSTLKRSFPEANIHFVLNENIAPLFQHHPDIDLLITCSDYDQSSSGRYIKKVKQIMRATKYDLIVDTRSTIKTMWFSLFSLSSPYRIGLKKSYNVWHNIRADIHSTDIDEVQRNLELIKPLETTYGYKLEYVTDFRLYVTEEEKRRYRQYMEEKGINFEKPVIVCAVTTRIETKKWNTPYMKTILQWMIDNYGAQLIFNYAKDEKGFAQSLYEEMDENPNIFITIEAKGLRELSALMVNANFFFGNEGGPRHIAQALEVPGFAIYPPNIPKTVWLPNACEKYQGIELADITSPKDWQNLSYKQQMDCITPEEVWKRLKPMLDKV